MTDAFTDENSCIFWLWTSTLENRVYQVSRVKSFTKFENHSYSSYHNEGFNLTDLATFHLRNFPSLKKCGNCDVFTHISFTGHTEQCHEDVFILGYIGILKRNYETFVYRHWRTYYYFWLLRNRPFSRDYSRLGRMLHRSSSVKIYAGPESCIDLHRRNVGVAGARIFRPDALPVTKPTVSKHWRNRYDKNTCRKKEIRNTAKVECALLELKQLRRGP